MKENAKQIRALWRKYKGLSSILTECMQRAIRASLNDRMHMLEEEFPKQAKELNDRARAKKDNIQNAQGKEGESG